MSHTESHRRGTNSAIWGMRCQEFDMSCVQKAREPHDEKIHRRKIGAKVGRETESCKWHEVAPSF